MKDLQTIPITNLILSFIPVVIVILIISYWKAGQKTSIYAMLRMIIQLLFIGYFLNFIFGSDQYWVVLAVLLIMLLSSSWIALRTIKIPLKVLYSKSLISIVVGGGLTLTLVTQGVLDLKPWYLPSYMIPLAGMIFASAMNSVSLAGERLQSELSRDTPYDKAKVTAFQASLIPITNSLFAVGLVSLPGMMTGQILSGVSPLIAVRYQIMVMCMTFGAAGMASAIFLTLVKPHFSTTQATTGS